MAEIPDLACNGGLCIRNRILCFVPHGGTCCQVQYGDGPSNNLGGADSVGSLTPASFIREWALSIGICGKDPDSSTNSRNLVPQRTAPKTGVFNPTDYTF